MMEEFGLIGLGKMGRNLALNAIDHGRKVVGYDSMPAARQSLAGISNAVTVDSLEELVATLAPPRVVVLLIGAGAGVDKVISSLIPLLTPGDVLVDAGNSHFRDSERRAGELTAHGIEFVGLGVSGGEEGARFGPALMAGGSATAVKRLWSALGPIAARAHDRLCQDHFGTSGAGHFVKMVHNGIEYADMQLIAETVHLLRRGYNLPLDAMSALLSEWNQGILSSYLLGITADILVVSDPTSGQPLLDQVVDVAGQNGTGHWSVVAAMELGVSVPTICAALEARILSGQARNPSRLRSGFGLAETTASDAPVALMHDALFVARLCALAQGFALLDAGRRRFGWEMSLSDVAANWRAGCILQSRLLPVVGDACGAVADGGSLLWDDAVIELITGRVGALQRIVSLASEANVAIPAMGSALAYIQALASDRLWADVIQLQRDYFGGHGFALANQSGVAHGLWRNKR